MVTELENRFSAVNAALRQGIQACSPVSANVLSEPHLAELAHHYNIDLKTEEVIVARHFLTRKKQAGAAPQDIVSFYNLLDSEMFPSLKSVIQVALTVPVSSCSCEVFQCSSSSPQLAKENNRSEQAPSTGSYGNRERCR